MNVIIGDEADLQIDVALKYIKSGQDEIRNYVETVSKPDLSAFYEPKKEYMETLVKQTEDNAKDYTEQAKESADEAAKSAKSASEYVDTIKEQTTLITKEVVNNKFLLVAELPEDADDDIWYAIPEE
jgi:hypothetical protein